jgi:hypothetical protein
MNKLCFHEIRHILRSLTFTLFLRMYGILGIVFALVEGQAARTFSLHPISVSDSREQ